MRRCAGLWLVVLMALVVARPAKAFEFFGGALQIHGFGESIVRVLNDDFSSEYNLSQMQFVLNLETELDIAPDGIGPFTAVSAYARVEIRYDCVWRNACYLGGGVDHVGDRIVRVPHERSNARDTDTFSGTAFSKSDGCGPEGCRLQMGGRVVKIKDAGPFSTVYENKGPDQILKTKDDPAPLILGKFGNYIHTNAKIPGSINGRGTQTQLPLRPKDIIPTENGLFRFHPNALSPLEEDASCAASTVFLPAGCRFGYTVVESVGGILGPAGIPPGSAVGDIVLNPENFKPYRPYPLYSAETAAKTGLNKQNASGLYFPSYNLINYLRNEDQGPFDQNYSQTELEWNHGASQQDEGVLKEFYFDIEMMDGRLWFRLGKQTIVWGKTEIFRSQDQWNPQDVGLATLPSLEESRIGLWAARMTYSFYDVGPLQDVRLEVAALLDEFEPVDLGRCGELYAPNPVYGKCLGLFAHSAVGIGVAGETRPMNWWDSQRGLEFGARLEFRWRRFSFAVTDYYGFNDFPTADAFNNYSRNVDPYTGRPRWATQTTGCDPEGMYGGGTKGCLGWTDNMPFPTFTPDFSPQNFATWGDQPFDVRIAASRERNFERGNQKKILEEQPANQTFFNFACAASVGFTDIIPDAVTECGFNIFGSNKILDTGFAAPFDRIPIVAGLSIILGGSSTLYGLAINFLAPEATGIPLTVVPLNHNDLGPNICTGPSGKFCIEASNFNPESRTHEGFGPLDLSGADGALAFLYAPFGSLASALTPEQQALLGCGAYYGTSCDRQGIDLLNTEGSAIFQSFPGFDGTANFGFDMRDRHIPSPGTVGFNGGPVCTRFERGKTFILPGCRGPGDPGYNPAIDGSPYFSEMHNHADIPLSADITNASDLRQFDIVSTANGCDSILTEGPNPTQRLKSADIRLFNPINCQPFQSEMAAMSFNFLAVAVLFSSDSDDDGFSNPEDFDEFDATRPFDTNRCSLAAPQFCSVVRSLMGASGVGKNSIQAAGNYSYGRRDFTWHGGQELALRYDRRNVFGISSDFSEDWSKTNWGLEFTWIDKVRFADRESPNGLTTSNVYNLTISMDRPTFINFLNANRTLLFNTQWFLSYVPEHTDSWSANGPLNVLATFTALTGYFQDRLFAVLTIVYDFQSVSGAGLPSLSYRFNEAFSVQFGMAFFFGQYQDREPFLMPQALGNRTGSDQYQDFVQNGLAVVRDRDEFFFRFRYTF